MHVLKSAEGLAQNNIRHIMRVVQLRECDRKLPNRLPNFRLISCLIDCLIVLSSLISNLGFILIGDALRDHTTTPEMGTFVPNGRRHGAMAAAGGPDN